MAFSLDGWNIGHADDAERGPWGVDERQRVAALVEADGDVRDLYAAVRAAAGAPPVDLTNATVGRPRLTESWFCCAEPTELQLQRSGATEVSLQSRC